MKQPAEVLRDFKKPDEEVLQQADLKLISFVENKNKLVERFPELADPFAGEWGIAINYARSILPDYASVASQSRQTNDLNALIEEGANRYQTLLLYVKIAFPKDATVLRLFGQSQYASASRSRLKLPILLRTASELALKPEYKTALVAKGMKEAEIDALATMANNIVNQNVVQENAMKQRTLDANHRITALNLVWEKMSLVCQCAKLVFQKDITRYNLFLLSDGDSNTSKPEDTPG
jgi:hypothetical protein